MKQEMNQTIVKNWKQPKIVLMIFLVFMLALMGQFTYIALSKEVDGINLKALANSRSTTTRELLAKRGNIYDSAGNVLAINVTSYTLIAYLEPSRTANIDRPNHVVDIEKTAEELAEILNAPYDYVLSRLKMEGVYQVEFGIYGARLTELTKLAIDALELPGISFIESSKRFYPNGTFSSYIIGYARSFNDGSIVGELGIESRFNDILKGTNGKLTFQRDLAGYQIPDTPETRIPSTDGSDIYLTIDANIQRFLETSVKETTLKMNPEWMIMVVMDAKTGAILGSATTPSFDPNNLPSEMSYQNPLISLEYEPGSTMKTFTYLCALNTGLYKGDETYMSGEYRFPGAVVSDWRPQGWGKISFDTGYIHSSNVGSIQVARKYLSADKLRECFESLGFGKRAGIELSSETSGSLANINPTLDINWLSPTYGQGLSITAIQMLQALTVIANDGVMVKPHIIKQIVDGKTGEVTETPIVRSEQLFSKEATNYMKILMDGALNETWASAYTYHMDDIHIIGKTGTAQIFENGRYLNGLGNWLVSFSGMFPADDPQIIMYAAYAKPNEWYGRNLANPVKEVIRNIAKYKGMYETGSTSSSVKPYIVSNYINQNTAEVEADLKEQGLEAIIIGDGDVVINQSPAKGLKVVTGDKIFIVTNGNERKLASVIEWSRNDFERYMRLLGTQYSISGYGYIAEQSIPKGTVVDSNTRLEVILKNKFNLDERDE